MAALLDLQKLAAVLGMMGSDGDGEVLNAARMANRMIQVADMMWADFIEAAQRCEEAEERASKIYDAALQLQRERDRARTELQRVRETNGHGGGTLAAALWQDTTMPRTVENKHAEWALAVGIYLSPKERRFLESCARWRGPLTPNQRPWLEDLVRRAVARTGQTPPP
jgi:hypothetical protein